MMRPLEELMAYYAFLTIKSQRTRRPSLSAEAKELAVEFEALVMDGLTPNELLSHYGSRFSAPELTKLYGLFMQVNMVVQEESNLVEMDVDLAFEQKVKYFTRLQERARLRDRFKELELIEQENLVLTNEMKMNASADFDLEVSEIKPNYFWLKFVIVILLILLLLVVFTFLK
jgi:hypothetical protein